MEDAMSKAMLRGLSDQQLTDMGALIAAEQKRRVRCSTCNGTGEDNRYSDGICRKCKGTGKRTKRRGAELGA